MTFLTLAAWDFHPVDSLTTYAWHDNPLGIYKTSPGNTFFEAPVHLPEGAQVVSLQLHACDVNAGADIFTNVLRQPLSGLFTIAATGPSTSGTSACSNFVVTPTPFTIDNANNFYTVELVIGGTDINTRVSSFRIGYKLQVSPAPVTATFADVPVGSPFHRFVEALVAAGITGGCGGGNYCPDAPVTRGQMAVFLAGALGLHWAP